MIALFDCRAMRSKRFPGNSNGISGHGRGKGVGFSYGTQDQVLGTTLVVRGKMQGIYWQEDRSQANVISYLDVPYRTLGFSVPGHVSSKQTKLVLAWCCQ